jgi:hypothetical protein
MNNTSGFSFSAALVGVETVAMRIKANVKIRAIVVFMRAYS